MEEEKLILIKLAALDMLEVPERDDPYLATCSEEERLQLAMYRAGMTDPEAYGPLSGNLGNKHF